MKLLILGERDVHDLLGYPACAQAMSEVLGAVAGGEVYQPLRSIIRPPGADGLMALMPAYRAEDEAAYGLKAICVFPGNPARGLDAHQGGVMLFSGQTGEPLALLNASALTAIRTAAVSAVATSLLARPDAGDLAVIGTGVQAWAHVLAITATRPLSRIRVTARDAGRAGRFAAEAASRTGVPAAACASVAEAVAGAGIVVTATSSPVPVLRREWLAGGTHVNAVGACLPEAREIDTATMADAALYVDSRASALAEAGDVRLAMAEGAIGPDHIRAELGEVLTGAASGRGSDAEITLFESLGLAAEDLAAAACCYREALAAGRGTWADF